MTVFVSYSSRDKDAVKSLTQDLRDADEQVWLDQRLAGGDAWWRAILEQIRGCDVFIFALSQNSIQSKPCQAELQYAQALRLPILPVQVGPVDSRQLNPLATVPAIDYRQLTPTTAMQLVAALNRERARRQPLPSPLPDEPPAPFEYLIRLYTTIAGPDQLSPRDQAALVAQLQVGLREDGLPEAARKDIVMLLGKLRDRDDVTYRTRTDVDAILASIGAESRHPLPTATDITAVEYPIVDDAAKAASPTGQVTPASALHQVRPKQPPAPDVVWQQPAYLDLAATQQGPPGWAPVPPPRPADRPPRRAWWRRRAFVIPAALLTVAVIAVAIVVTSPQKQNSNGPQIAPPTGSIHRQPAYGPQVTLPFTGLDDPEGVAVDAAGDLHVACPNNGQVLKLAAGSSTPTVLPFTGLGNHYGVAVDTAGNLYVTDKETNRVLKLAAGSSTPTVLPFTDLGYPTGVAVDTAGNLYVIDGWSFQVVKLTADPSNQKVLLSNLYDPRGLAVDTAGNLYVADSGNKRVLKLAAGSPTPTVLPFILSDPRGVAVDSAGNVYVADYSSNRVLKLAAGSSTQIVLPFTGLSLPFGVAVDAAGNLYVTDNGNNRVLKLAAG